MKPWHKWHARKWLESETREKTNYVDRYVFRELIDLAHVSHEPGFVCDVTGRGHKYTHLSDLIDVGARQVASSVKKLSKIGAILVHANGAIEIPKYLEYQDKPKDRSEYDKKRYAKLKANSTKCTKVDEMCTQPLEGEGERDIEREGEVEEERTPPPPHKEMKNFLPANLPDTFQDEFTKLFHRCFCKEKTVVFIVEEGEDYAKKYGKEKLFDMMTQKAGKRWLYVKKDLDDPRNKPSKRGAETMKRIRCDCPKCKEHKLINTTASGGSWECEGCGFTERIPTDMTGLDINDLGENQQNIIKQMENRKAVG